jgi:hypothetical protein
MTDWRDMPDGKEKYGRYLCSREWGLLRAAVHERANGVCERCYVNKIDAVHHLTYARRYNEDLSDLQAICNACHAAVHGHAVDDVSDPATGVGFIYSQVFCRLMDMERSCPSPIGAKRFSAASDWIAAMLLADDAGERFKNQYRCLKDIDAESITRGESPNGN